MNTNRPGYSTLDEAVAAEVRAEFARQRDKTISELSEQQGLRRATLSKRINGQQPFTIGELTKVANYLGTTAEALTAEAKRRMQHDKEAVA